MSNYPTGGHCSLVDELKLLKIQLEAYKTLYEEFYECYTTLTRGERITTSQRTRLAKAEINLKRTKEDELVTTKHKDLFDFLNTIERYLCVELAPDRLFEVHIDNGRIIEKNGMCSTIYGQSEKSIDDAIEDLKRKISGLYFLEDNGDYGEKSYNIPVFSTGKNQNNSIGGAQNS